MATTVNGVAGPNTGVETFGTTSPVTGTAPTAIDGTDGHPVDAFGAVTVTASVVGGGTFAGAGNLDCYVYFPAVGAWSRYKGGDLDITAASGFTNFTFDACLLVGRYRGCYLKWVPNGVTFFGGTASGVKVVQQGVPASRGDGKVWP
jgi:hypothetical protein